MTRRLLSFLLLLSFSGTQHGIFMQISAAQSPAKQPVESTDSSTPVVCPANTEEGFELQGLIGPAVVAQTIFVDAPAVPASASVTYYLDKSASSGAEYPFPMGHSSGYSLLNVSPGVHCLEAVATLADGKTMHSNMVTLQVVQSINALLSAGLDAYANQPSAQLQDLDSVLDQLSTPGAALTTSEVAVRKSVLAMYMNWGIDPSLDNANDQSQVLLSLSPQGWLPGKHKAASVPLSMLFSSDAPYYQPIPDSWPRVLLPSRYIRQIQLNTVKEGDGIGFGESVAHTGDGTRSVQSQWYGMKSTYKSFQYRLLPDWIEAMPWQTKGDRHMIFVDTSEDTFISSYMTSLNKKTGGPDALYASSPTKLGTLGDQGGSIAAKFAELPAMLQPGEAINPHQPVGHAIGGSLARTWAGRVYPASARDGGILTSKNSCTGIGFTNTGLVPYGGVIQLDPQLNLGVLKLTLPAFRILQAMQTYGYYVEDFGCADLDIYTAISETELDPYGGLWGYNGKGVGVQNELQRVLSSNKLYVVAPLTKKE